MTPKTLYPDLWKEQKRKTLRVLQECPAKTEISTQLTQEKKSENIVHNWLFRLFPAVQLCLIKSKKKKNCLPLSPSTWSENKRTTHTKDPQTVNKKKTHPQQQRLTLQMKTHHKREETHSQICRATEGFNQKCQQLFKIQKKKSFTFPSRSLSWQQKSNHRGKTVTQK